MITAAAILQFLYVLFVLCTIMTWIGTNEYMKKNSQGTPPQIQRVVRFVLATAMVIINIWCAVAIGLYSQFMQRFQ